MKWKRLIGIQWIEYVLSKSDACKWFAIYEFHIVRNERAKKIAKLFGQRVAWKT